MNKSVNARNTVVAFYLEVFRGVIYISAGKAAVDVCRQVDKLILIGYPIA